jgi:PAS domain S-box-containing protein
LLFHNAPVGYQSLDENGYVLDVSDVWLETLGYSRDEVTGHWFGEFLHPEQRKVYHELFRINVQSHSVIRGVEFRLLRKDGTQVTVEYTARIGRDAQGRFVRTHCVFQDITERKHAEEALRESEAQYMDLYENAPDMYASVNAQTALVEQCNHTLADALGSSKEEIIGRPVFELYHPDCLEEVKKTFELFIKTGEIHDKELQLQRKDGSRLDVSLNVSSVRGEGGNILYSRSTLRDITERKRHNAIIASRLHLMQFAVTHSLDELLEETLNEAEKLADSLIGFYHFVEDDQKSLTLQNWSTRTKTEFCRAEGKGMHYALIEAGVWVDCVYQRKPVIHNDYASLPHRKGMPEGHAKVIRELVVPVLRGEKIKAILGVGNKPSDYTEQDVEAITLLADLAWGIAERKWAEEALHRLNRELQALSDCNQTLLRAADERTLLDEICRIICDVAGYRLAWVGYAEHDDAKTVRPVAWAGFDSMYVASAQLSWADDTERGRGPAGKAIRSGKVIYVQDFVTDPQMAPWRESTLQHGYRSGIALPLKDDNAQVFGVLLIYHSEPNAMTQDEMRLLRELADDLAFGIIVLRARIKLQQSRQDLQRTNDLLRVIIEAAPTAIIGLDLDGKVQTVWNPAAEKMLGWSAQEVMGRFLPSVPKDKEEEFRQFREWMRSGKALNGVEVQRQKRDGTLIDYSIYAAALHGPEGQIAGNVAVLVDITERKQAEDALQQRASQLALLNKIGRQVAALLDLDEVLDRAAHLVQELFGFHHIGLFTQAKGTDRLVMKAWADEFAPLFPPDHSVALGQGMVGWVGLHGETLLANDAAAEPHFVNLNSDRLPTCSELSVPIRIGDEIVGVLDVQSPQPNAFDENDVMVLETLASQIAIAVENARLFTEAQTTLRQLKKTQAQLVQSAKLAAIGELAAGVAHEINNPLTSILGFAELASWELAPDAPGREELEIILAEAKRTRDIVRNLLDFARQTKPLTEMADVNHVLRQTLALVRAHVGKNGVIVKEQYAPDLGRIPLDVSRIKQVFLNLITNAAHAMPEGGTLTVSTAQVKDQVTVSIADTGRGIPSQDRKRIFEPFFTTKPSGTGLGLSVSLGIVQQHEGRIEVESQVGKGSTFTVWLPAGGGT